MLIPIIHCTETIFDNLRGSGNSLFTKSSSTHCARYGRIKVLSFMRLSSISPPATSFQDRSLTMLFRNSSANGLNAIFFNGKFLLQFNNFRMRPNFVNNYVSFIKNVNFGSSGHSNKSLKK